MNCGDLNYTSLDSYMEINYGYLLFIFIVTHKEKDEIRFTELRA
jgi:hypothetical protein